ncbi:MAG TPA: IPT/TIG domain-containing protein, partial [Candidatus Ozemobacteraceae bacterium]
GWAVGGNPAVLPRLASFTPASGLPGTWVTLSGTGFVSRSGTAPTVQFNGATAALQEWSASSIVAMVPETAESGPVSVVTSDGTSTGGAFTVLDYQITLTPAFGPPESVITLSGSGFGDSPVGQVLVNGHAATVTSWSDRTVRAIVPRLATSGPVTAVIRGRTHTAGTFTVSQVTTITPARSLRGTTITLTGSGFGEDQGDSALTVASGVAVVPDSWSATAITFTVPPEAVSGPVAVRIGGLIIRSPTLSVEYANRYDVAGQWSGPRVTAFPETPGVAVATDGVVFLTDRGNHVIWKFAPNGTVAKRIGTYGQAPGQIGDPWGLCIDLQGFLWMSDRENHRLQKTDRNGNLTLVTGQFGVNPGQFDTPSGLAADGAGTVWVADTQNDRIQRFAADGGFLLSIGTSGSGDGQFNYPSGVAIGPTGDIFVADTDNNRVQRLDGNGAPIGWWGRDNLGGTGWHAAGSGLEGRSGSQLWEFDGPMSLCFDASGRLIVADAGNNRLQVLPLGPGIATQIATGGAQMGQLLAPTGVVASGTTVWVADLENSRAQLFGTDGSFKAERRPDLDALTTSADRLAVDNERGLVYVSDRAEGLISVFTTSGAFVRRVGSPGTGAGQLQQPAGLKVATDGSLWVVDAGNARIQHFDGDGALLASFGGFGTGNGQFREPAGLALLANGDLAVADSGNDRIQILGTDGSWKRSVGRSGHLNGELDTPQGVGADRAGNLYVADTLNGRVQKFGPTGAFLGWWGLDTAGGVGWHGPETSIAASKSQSPCQFLGPSDIAVDAEGSVFVVDATAGTVQKFSPGHATEDDAGYLLTIDLGANLRGAAVDSAGVLYLTADDQVIRSLNPSLR